MESDADRLIVERIRHGDASAWEDCIGRYEGRLQAFIHSRLQNRTTSEDVVQDTFIGFLNSLPNYDPSTPLETWLFSIAAHKLTDVLRKQGRRPVLPLLPSDSQGGSWEPPGPGRPASSLMRSQERKSGEEDVIRRCLDSLIQQWIENGEVERLKCVELLFVLGWPNKDVAKRLDISEQVVANHKYFIVSHLKTASRAANLSDSDLERFGVK